MRRNARRRGLPVHRDLPCGARAFQIGSSAPSLPHASVLLGLPLLAGRDLPAAMVGSPRPGAPSGRAAGPRRHRGGAGAAAARQGRSPARQGRADAGRRPLRPIDEVVRLSLPHHDGRSVAALAVAAHEVGHALQHANGDRTFALRCRLAPGVIWFERAAQVVFFSIPLLGVAARSPSSPGCRSRSHRAARVAPHRPSRHAAGGDGRLFKRALPILQAGRFVPRRTCRRRGRCCGRRR